ncbi:MAG: MinD/ParA family protein [Deltaproteobacteria bacterium]|nr:MinD/ParA family protein [Deltaproteobacteria bacterium]
MNADVTPGPELFERAVRDRLRVVAVTSGKGGVGKSNVAANLAVAAARLGKRVLLIDADLGLANIEILFGLKPRYHVGHLLSGEAPIERVLVDGPFGIKLLSAGSGISSLTSLGDEEKRRLIDMLEPIEDDYDLVLLDTGAGIGPNVRFFAGAAEEVILVVSPEPTSLLDAYVALKVLSVESGVLRFSVVINPVVDARAAREVFPRLSSVATRFLKTRLGLLGYVPRDDNVPRAILHGRPVLDLFPSAPASRAFLELGARFLSEPPEGLPGGGLKLMWRRLLREAQSPTY